MKLSFSPACLGRIAPLVYLPMLLLVLATCATPAAKPPPVCGAGETALRSAQAWFYAPERTVLTSAAYNASPQTGGMSGARRVQQDLDAEAAAIDRLDQGYGSVESCHLAQLRALRTRQAAGSLPGKAALDAIADERHALDEARSGTHVALAHASALAAIYSAAAENLASGQPNVQVAVERANAEPHPTVGYKVTARATIYVRPDIHSGTVAPIRKGQRVSGPQAVPKPGWVTIELNDGSIGYVEADIVRPVPLNPSALNRAHGHHLEINDNPIVTALLTARRTLPEKTQALEARLESARDEELPPVSAATTTTTTSAAAASSIAVR